MLNFIMNQLITYIDARDSRAFNKEATNKMAVKSFFNLVDHEKGIDYLIEKNRLDIIDRLMGVDQYFDVHPDFLAMHQIERNSWKRPTNISRF